MAIAMILPGKVRARGVSAWRSCSLGTRQCTGCGQKSSYRLLLFLGLVCTKIFVHTLYTRGVGKVAVKTRTACVTAPERKTWLSVAATFHQTSWNVSQDLLIQVGFSKAESFRPSGSGERSRLFPRPFRSSR